jgi:microcystin-dependent protein
MGPEDYMGSVQVTAGVYAPQNTALCQGQLVAIAQNSALYYLLRTTYGGNGVSTFGLPNLVGATPFGTGQQAGTGSTWTLGQATGTLAEVGWPEGQPKAVGTGETATLPTIGGPGGLALNWAITLLGIFPPQPD